ncbi:S-adenosyl-L-methionine-dependent methyltransferase [Artomyces pyxidatus]|uniref:S-adenosyl-L-methionine-dependent methyltransferase n=1 Tax=Artomyces pyxidatus TaxID=48021 RepID=A0ACB8T4S1_9AGAM|nr:S-adenosyl-L-methionine-dependent methyltransferase [Artomyces pyxidatus]
MSTLSAQDIASVCLYSLADPPSEQKLRVQKQSTEHRISIVSKWDIPAGAKLLEIGCGQGDTTAVLAELVGPNGHVTAVDPGPLDYGSPFTLGQAQAHLSAGRLGSRITWKQAEPIALLEADDTQYDAAVLAICIWYFNTPTLLRDTLAALAKRVRTVYIAEWSLSSPLQTAQTHVLAALTQAALEAHNPAPHSNIRIAASPVVIRAQAAASGWALQSEGTITPADHILDGRWETMEVQGERFLKQIHELIPDERQRTVVLSLRDATLASLESDGGIKKVKSMDVWCATFTRSS